MAFFPEYAPRETPNWFFPKSARLLFETAVRADIEKQNCSVMPRYWYIDAVIRCRRCSEDFVFSAAEQRVWYEDERRWIDAYTTRCPSCLRHLQELNAMRREYDTTIAKTLKNSDVESKANLIALIDQLEERIPGLPQRLQENREMLQGQIERLKTHNPVQGNG